MRLFARDGKEGCRRATLQDVSSVSLEAMAEASRSLYLVAGRLEAWAVSAAANGVLLFVLSGVGRRLRDSSEKKYDSDTLLLRRFPNFVDVVFPFDMLVPKAFSPRGCPISPIAGGVSRRKC